MVSFAGDFAAVVDGSRGNREWDDRRPGGYPERIEITCVICFMGNEVLRAINLMSFGAFPRSLAGARYEMKLAILRMNQRTRLN